jgi:hypothetical protein
MATQEEALSEFLKALRIAINYISLYSRAHRSFLGSVAVLKEKLEVLLTFLYATAANAQTKYWIEFRDKSIGEFNESSAAYQDALARLSPAARVR